MAEEGFLAFVQEKRAQLPPGAEEPDWEDEWDDLTLAQKAPYVENREDHRSFAETAPKAVSQHKLHAISQHTAFCSSSSHTSSRAN